MRALLRRRRLAPRGRCVSNGNARHSITEPSPGIRPLVRARAPAVGVSAVSARAARAAGAAPAGWDRARASGAGRRRPPRSSPRQRSATPTAACASACCGASSAARWKAARAAAHGLAREQQATLEQPQARVVGGVVAADTREGERLVRLAVLRAQERAPGEPASTPVGEPVVRARGGAARRSVGCSSRQVAQQLGEIPGGRRVMRRARERRLESGACLRGAPCRAQDEPFVVEGGSGARAVGGGIGRRGERRRGGARGSRRHGGRAAAAGVTGDVAERAQCRQRLVPRARGGADGARRGAGVNPRR